MHFTVEAQKLAARHLHESAIAIDATAGNGFDTLFLAHAVGATGIVYACDIQSRAIEQTRIKLADAGLIDRVRLHVQSHDCLGAIVDSQHHGIVSVAMFNLGYLPFGDKSLTTHAATTIPALEQCERMLKPKGLLIVLVYRGHEGGEFESEQVARWMERRKSQHQVSRLTDPANPKSPILWILEVTPLQHVTTACVQST